MNRNLTIEALARAGVKVLLIAGAAVVAGLALICWLDYWMGVPLRFGAPGVGMLALTILLLVTMKRARRGALCEADEAPVNCMALVRRSGRVRQSPASVLRKIVIVDGAPPLDADAQWMRSELIN
jgi:hypothetical protein